MRGGLQLTISSSDLPISIRLDLHFKSTSLPPWEGEGEWDSCNGTELARLFTTREFWNLKRQRNIDVSYPGKSTPKSGNWTFWMKEVKPNILRPIGSFQLKKLRRYGSSKFEVWKSTNSRNRIHTAHSRTASRKLTAYINSSTVERLVKFVIFEEGPRKIICFRFPLGPDFPLIPKIDCLKVWREGLTSGESREQFQKRMTQPNVLENLKYVHVLKR